MPPPDSGRSLNDKQIAKIRMWIEQGAEYQQHWSLNPPTSPYPPSVTSGNWAKNTIDTFVLSELEKSGLVPNGEANRATLIRRLSLDLTGLPPEESLFQKYQNSSAQNWYEQLVDELIAAPQFGEHQTRFWLDISRYGDTHGLHLDNYREMWLYRDWLINAFNAGMPYDQFLTEQLAGDLLDNPTEQQRVATGFNRAHVTTNEGGSISEEVYVRNVVDRVSTTGTVFMGLTIGCAQCHDHKFDPISQKDFYQLFAFFNSLEANPMDGNGKAHAPVLSILNDEQRKQDAEFTTKIEQAEQEIREFIRAYDYREPTTSDDQVVGPFEFTWLDDFLPVGAKQEQAWNPIHEKNGKVRSGKTAWLQTANPKQMVQHFFINAPAPLIVSKGDVLFTYVYIDSKNPPNEIMLQFNDGNWEHRAYWGDNVINWGQDKSASRYYQGPLPEADKWIRLEVPAELVGFAKPSRINGIAFTQAGGRVFWDDSGVVSATRQEIDIKSLKQWQTSKATSKGEGLPNDLKTIFQSPLEKWTDEQKQKSRNYFLTNVFAESRAAIQQKKATVTSLRNQQNKFKQSIPTTLVWKELKTPKDAFILTRGEYDQKGEKVGRAVPDSIAPWSDEFPKDRLGLAKWLLKPEHPLTARVAVNRFWQQVFGRGIVLTSEDFGAQGTPPSHPELLDWLATDFVKNGWDIKRIVKQMVMSATYRQASNVSPEKLAADPDNRLLSRGSRYRLDAEVLRDQALAVSGLLVRKIGGPSVKPPQPDGLWFAVGYSDSNTVRFRKDMGHEKVHRRSMYTFWKRTAVAPQMSTLDAPTRESCSVRRERTNTPLQALLLMNDPQYVEAARFLAQRTLDLKLENDEQRMRQSSNDAF